MNNERGCMACKIDKNGAIKYRSIFSHMILSHIAIIIPCIWWLLGPNKGDYYSVAIDKFMAITLTICISFSVIYHYYYECVICNLEEIASIIGVVILNLYMIYRGISYLYIGLGFVIILLLKILINYVAMGKNNNLYEDFHAYCHYIAGIYVTYCVYFIRGTFK
jgi:hypothetical protein